MKPPAFCENPPGILPAAPLAGPPGWLERVPGSGSPGNRKKPAHWQSGGSGSTDRLAILVVKVPACRL
ncbi:MAG: hypothetical protein DWH82_04065 [Planctomycetota bacterium]|nr:MAG: hypothetical protein DWH82_04065 [Planctomycetota bacterium]